MATPTSYAVKKGRTSFLARLFILDSTRSDGGGLSGLVFNSTSLTCYRSRDDDGNAGATAVTLQTATRGTWTTRGFVEKDATNAPGWYEFGVEDAALATGSESVEYVFKGAANMVACNLKINLVGHDPQDAVRLGLTALPNVASGSAGALVTAGSGTAQLNVSGGKAPATLAAADVSGNVPADVQTIKTQAVTCAAGVTVNVNVGATQPLNFTGTGASALVQVDLQDWRGSAPSALSSGLVQATATVSGTVSANLTQVGGTNIPTPGVAGVLPVDVAYLNGGTITAVASVPIDQSAVIDGSVASSVGEALLKADALPSDPADESLIIAATDAIMTRLGAPAGASVSVDVAAVKVDTAAIKAKTDNLPASPAAVGSAMTLTSGERDSIAAAFLDLTAGVESGWTPRQLYRQLLGMAAGLTSGMATATALVKNPAGTKTRVTATVDASGNRSAVTVDNS